MTTDQIIDALLMLLSAAYGFIFYSVMGRLRKLEELGCNPALCERRFLHIEDKQDKLDPVLMEIKERLVRIEVTLEEIKKKS